MINKLVRLAATAIVLASLSTLLLAAETPPKQMILGKGTNLAHWLSQTRRTGEEQQMWDVDGNRDEAAFEIMHNAIRWGLANDLMVLID